MDLKRVKVLASRYKTVKDLEMGEGKQKYFNFFFICLNVAAIRL